MWALLSLYLLAYLLAGLIAAGIYKRQARRTSATAQLLDGRRGPSRPRFDRIIEKT
jgi:hypothetical protein